MVYDLIVGVAIVYFIYRKLKLQRQFESQIFIGLFIYARLVLPAVDLASSIYLWFDYNTNPNVGASGETVSIVLLAFSLLKLICYLYKGHLLMQTAMDSSVYDVNYLTTFSTLFGPSGGLVQFCCNAVQPIVIYLHVNRFMIPGRDVSLAAYVSIIITTVRFLGKRIHKIVYFIVAKLLPRTGTKWVVEFQDAYDYLDDEIKIEYRLRSSKNRSFCAVIGFIAMMKVCKCLILLLSAIILILNRFTSTCIRQHQLNTLHEKEVIDNMCTWVMYIHTPMMAPISYDWFIDRIESDQCKQLIYEDGHLVANSKWLKAECLSTLEVVALVLTSTVYLAMVGIFLNIKLRMPETRETVGYCNVDAEARDAKGEKMGKLYSGDL